MPAIKPAGMETRPGLVSGNHEKSTFGNIAVSAPETAGEKKIRISATPRPTHREATAPVVLNFFQYREYRIVGRLADAAMQNARETRKATFWSIARMPSAMETSEITTTVIRETRTCSSSVAWPLRSTPL